MPLRASQTRYKPARQSAIHPRWDGLMVMTPAPLPSLQRPAAPDRVLAEFPPDGVGGGVDVVLPVTRWIGKQPRLSVWAAGLFLADALGLPFGGDIPVVKTGDLYHYDVRQKVPLSLNRDNVPPAYLKLLRTAVLDHTHHLITPENTSAVPSGSP